MKITGVENLKQLLVLLKNERRTAEELEERDWTSLPTFGGEEPADTFCVWSWDAENLLVGTCADDFRIVARNSDDV